MPKTMDELNALANAEGLIHQDPDKAADVARAGLEAIKAAIRANPKTPITDPNAPICLGCLAAAIVNLVQEFAADIDCDNEAAASLFTTIGQDLLHDAAKLRIVKSGKGLDALLRAIFGDDGADNVKVEVIDLGNGEQETVTSSNSDDALASLLAKKH